MTPPTDATATGLKEAIGREDDLYGQWLRSDDKVKLDPRQLRKFQARLNVQIAAEIEDASRIRRIAACIRDSFSEGLDEGVSMDIARKIVSFEPTLGWLKKLWRTGVETGHILALLPFPADRRGREALKLARPIVEADWYTAREQGDADWEGLSWTALDAIDKALAAPETPPTEGESFPC